MKILHLCLDCPFNDGWGYQDNLLPKYQKKLGHEVLVVTTNTIQENGEIKTVPTETFVSKDGYTVIRLDYHNIGIFPFRKLMRKYDISKIIYSFKPDIIFSHGLINISLLQAIKYKKDKGCIIVQDNHLDYNIGVNKKILKKSLKAKIIRMYYILLNSYTQKYVSKVYGVTPWRKLYAEDYYKISSDKTDTLIMGADDEKIDFLRRNDIKSQMRKRYGIQESDFFIVTGGKIDNRKKITDLMKAVNQIDNVKLLIFGNILEEVREEFYLNLSSKIIYIGWVESDKVYNLFLAADLVVFPGQHSVLWEQACACKVPCDMSTLFWTYLNRTIYLMVYEFIVNNKIAFLALSRVK